VGKDINAAGLAYGAITIPSNKQWLNLIYYF
jgi:hypothetical protein